MKELQEAAELLRDYASFLDSPHIATQRCYELGLVLEEMAAGSRPTTARDMRTMAQEANERLYDRVTNSINECASAGRYSYSMEEAVAKELDDRQVWILSERLIEAGYHVSHQHWVCYFGGLGGHNWSSPRKLVITGWSEETL